ncbi:MAG: ATP-binding cassette domain-containing protein, partial [Burkholderiales bacterium]
MSALLEVEQLEVSFGGRVSAVRGASVSVERGETHCLVGESGCGKSVTALSILRLIPTETGRITQGSIRFEGTELTTLAEEEMKSLRGHRISMIFQEPMTRLNPVLTVGTQIAENVVRHMNVPWSSARERAREMLDLVRIADCKRRIDEYPHQLSGGMRQRVMIAMALSCEPQVLIADEPTTALDVTVAARILELLARLKQNFGMAMIFISHDLGLVRQIADRVHVMREGEIVEAGFAAEVTANPRHEYSRMLLAAMPRARAHNQTDSPVLLRAENISVRFSLRGGLLRAAREIRAVDGVSLSLKQGRSLGLVGESGSGKSTLARAILKLVPASGIISFDGRDLTPLHRAAMRPLRRSMQL